MWETPGQDEAVASTFTADGAAGGAADTMTSTGSQESAAMAPSSPISQEARQAATELFAGQFGGPEAQGENVPAVGDGNTDGGFETYGWKGTALKAAKKAAVDGVKRAGKTAGEEAGNAAKEGTLGQKAQDGSLRDDIVDGLKKTKLYPNLDDFPLGLTDTPISGGIQRGLGLLIGKTGEWDERLNNASKNPDGMKTRPTR